MIVYNITTHVSWPIHDDWRTWLMEEFIPTVLGTALFTHYQFVRLIEVDEEDGATYALQLYSSDVQKFGEFRNKFLPYLQQKEKERWGNSAVSFGSLMEVIN